MARAMPPPATSGSAHVCRWRRRRTMANVICHAVRAVLCCARAGWGRQQAHDLALTTWQLTHIPPTHPPTNPVQGTLHGDSRHRQGLRAIQPRHLYDSTLRQLATVRQQRRRGGRSPTSVCTWPAACSRTSAACWDPAAKVNGAHSSNHSKPSALLPQLSYRNRCRRSTVPQHCIAGHWPISGTARSAHA